MEFIEPIFIVAEKIYTHCEQVKANKKRCHRVAQRVKALEELVQVIKQKGPGQNSTEVARALCELKITLESAEELIKKYTSAKFLERLVKACNHGDEFGSLNERLNDAFQVLSLALQVDQGEKILKVFEIASRQEEDEADRKCDLEELQKVLYKTAEEVRDLIQSMETLMKTINKPRIIHQVIREIKAEELNYSFPKVPFMKTPDSEVYKGEYKQFTVAIKRYTNPTAVNPSTMRSMFEKEVENMRRFESPNILRMFGICVQDENGPNANYLIIMEYCEKGSLRQVLDSNCKLPWDRKARMCLDAAQGLYRLHQSEEKSKVHGCINSSKFLVAEGYRVKVVKKKPCWKDLPALRHQLGGLELAKTQSSLRKVKDQENSSFCYSCPQQMESINHLYSKECEMYSFGIVLWEIATRKKPFEDCSSRLQVFKKVCEDKLQEPLPEDCPSKLGQLINACRAYDRFQRPSSGVLVDKLRKMVEQLEEE